MVIKMNVFKFGMKYWKKYLPSAIVAELISFLVLTADLLMPLFSEMFIDYCIGDSEPDTSGVFGFLLTGKYGQVHTFRLFAALAVSLLGLLLLRCILVYIRNIMQQKQGLGLETDLRMAAYDKLMLLDSEKISEYNTGELLNILSTDTIMFKEMFCHMIPYIIDSVFAISVAIYFLWKIDISLLWIPLFLAPVFTYELMHFKKLAKEKYGVIRKNNSALSLKVQENIEAVRLVRSFTNEEMEEKQFDTINERLKQSHIDQIWLSSKFEVVFGIIRQAAYIGSIAVAAVLVIRGQIKVGYLVACTNYVLKIMSFLTQINNYIFQMQQQLVSGEKMRGFMECPIDIESGSRKIEEAEPVNLRMEHVSLVLGGNKVLDDINVDIPWGKKLGVVGGTGCGKSLLLESLSRIHDAGSGQITLNGINITEYDLESLRSIFSYVFQDVFLFSDTIDANIAYSEPYVRKDEIVTAAKHAQAHGFIMDLPDDYSTIVGEKGIGISGGQKQRVAIARALLKGAPVLIFDDSTSALDVKTEHKLLGEIARCYRDKTVIISAHRLSSVVDCDEILYMQDGRIVERGTFDELMKLNGHFAKVYRIQENAKYKEVE